MSYVPYAVRDDLTTYSLTAAALTGTSTAAQDKALVAASMIADGYLSSRFQLPLTTWGEDLKRQVCEIAAYILMKRRGFSPELADADQLKGGHDSAMKWLEGIAGGRITPVGLVDSSTGAGQPNTTGAATQDAPFVAAPAAGSTDPETFWGRGSDAAPATGSTTPRKRGW